MLEPILLKKNASKMLTAASGILVISKLRKQHVQPIIATTRA